MSDGSKAQRLNPFQHALKRPDTYIGSAKTVTSDIWIFNDETKNAIQKRIRYNPGLFNIVREILSNSIDNVWRSKEKSSDNLLKKIEITVNSETGEISIWNDGYCIPVHKEESEYTEPRTGKVITESIYPAEMFFGDMFSGTNYDDDQVRKTSGRNGMGAKATNVFSTEFKVECSCPADKAKFNQTYTKNGTLRSDPNVVKFNNKVGYTLISFTPDYEYFKFPGTTSDSEKSSIYSITEDFISLIKLYAHEVAMITGVLVKFIVNDEVTSIKINTLEKYVRMFYPSCEQNKMTTILSPSGDECVLVEGDEPEMDILETISQISFVNGIRTKDGGMHINTWRDAFIPAIVKAFNSRSTKGNKEKVQVKTSAKEVYPYLHMFVRVEVDRPRFGSQTKDELTEIFNEKGKSIDYKLFDTKNKKEKDEWSKTLENAVKRIMKWNFVLLLEEKLLAKMDRTMAKKERSSKRIKMGAKADDANEAGGKKSYLCTAYIAEGLSAKSFVIRGISSLPSGQDFNGAFAVKGKFINVQNSTPREVDKNEEVQQLKEFLGLTKGLDYTKEENVKTLRYGKVCILTDADDDGIHIRGLLLNFFYKSHPGLIEQGYVDSFSTAVAAVIFKRASKSQKSDTLNSGKLLFYSNPEFKKWYNSDEAQKIKSMDVKYYKGLGSINPKDAPAYFKNKKEVKYFMEGKEEEFMDLGFNKEFSDPRKEWITKDMDSSNFHTEVEGGVEDEFDLEGEVCSSSDNDEEYIEENKPVHKRLELAEFVYEGKLGLSSFVNDQLVIYHRMALRRALPSVWDGLKESQRKILFTILLRNYKKTSDLEKIMGAVKEETKYHHGGSSVQETIIKMAQGYVGSNNIPLLVNDGEFGTRLNGGSDHAAARYPATMAEKITRIIFSVYDDALLERLIEDNEPIEYRFYMPILPMILVNGVKGIASGYSTDIPSYNPLDLVHWIEMWLDGKSKNLDSLVPWYRGYTGEIKLEKFVKGRATGWISKGILEEGFGKEKGWWHIRELPIGTWTKSFEEWLEYLESGIPPKDKKWKKKDVRGLHDIKTYCTPNKVHFMIKPTKDFIPDMNIAGNLKIMQSTKSLNNMVAIDENDYPRRFGSPEEILRFFCPMRLKYYGLRKNRLLEVLKRDLIISSNRYRFVKGVVDKKLDLHQSDDELEILLSSDLWHFNKVDSGQSKELSYDYLLSMQMRSMTVKKLEELKIEAEKISEEIRILESKTIKDIWKNDLNKFKTEYTKFLKTRCEE